MSGSSMSPACPARVANLELAAAVAEEGTEPFFQHCLALDTPPAPANTPLEFLVFCGIVGYGRHLAAGRSDVLPILRLYANDPRWRLREGVVTALSARPRYSAFGALS